MKTSQKYCTCHAKRLSTRCRPHVNVTKSHVCHAKRSNDTSETSKNYHLCRTSHRHGHTGIARTVADGCERLRSRTQRRANTPSTPDPRVKREPLLRIRKKRSLHIVNSSFQGMRFIWQLSWFVSWEVGLHTSQYISLDFVSHCIHLPVTGVRHAGPATSGHKLA